MARAKQRIRDAGLPYDVPDTAATANQTDRPKVLGRYGGLQRAAPSPVVQLNRAVAVSVVQGPAAELAILRGLPQARALADCIWPMSPMPTCCASWATLRAPAHEFSAKTRFDTSAKYRNFRRKFAPRRSGRLAFQRLRHAVDAATGLGNLGHVHRRHFEPTGPQLPDQRL